MTTHELKFHPSKLHFLRLGRGRTLAMMFLGSSSPIYPKLLPERDPPVGHSRPFFTACFSHVQPAEPKTRVLETQGMAPIGDESPLN